MKPKCSLWVAALCTLLAGCDTVSTKSGSPPGLVHGMPYYLPMGLITIKGQFDAAKLAAGANSNRGLTMGFLSATPSDSPAPSSPSDSTSSVTLIFYGWTITINAESEPDVGAGIQYAIPRRNYVFDDDYHVTVNSKHLLSAGNSTAQDRSADILGNVASLAAATTGINPFQKEFTTRTSTEKHAPFCYSFHPWSPQETRFVHNRLWDLGISLKVTPPDEPSSKEAPADFDPSRGLTCRLAGPVTVRLRYPKGNLGQSTLLNYSHQFLLPGRQVYVFDYHRVAFVKKVTEVGFSDGMPVDFHENFPSTILGALGIPKAIVGAFVPLPGGSSLGGSSSSGGTSTTASH